MGNVLKTYRKTEVLTLVRAEHSFRDIERRLGVRRETVSKYARKVGLRPLYPATATSQTWQAGLLKPAILGLEVAIGSGDPISIAYLESPSISADFLSGPRFDPVCSDGWQAGIEKAVIASIPKQARSACNPWGEWIAGEVRKGRNAMSIYQDMVEQFGFSNRYNSVKRYVRGLKKVDPERYDRLEFLPGEEAQVDYGKGASTRHPETGKMRRPRLFVMTLKYSRRSFRKVVWNSSKETWARLHEEAFRYFGGCPQYVVLDNLKEGIIKPDIYEPEINSVYAAMLCHYGVVADPARVGDPDRKGTVENAIQHTQNTALKGREFESIDAQNEWLMHWEERWASPRVHGRTKRQVDEMFAEEKPFLKQLPLESFRYFEQGVRTVWDDGCVEVKRSYYSALPAAIFSEVVVRIYDLEIEILDPKTLTVIRRHMRSARPGTVRMEDSDRIFNPSRMTQAFLEQAAKIGPKTRELCEDLLKEGARMGQRRIRGILSLARRHSAAVIEEACMLAVSHCVRSSKTVRDIVEKLEKKGDTKQTSLPLTQYHKLIRPLQDYAMFFEKHALQEKAGSLH